MISYYQIAGSFKLKLKGDCHNIITLYHNIISRYHINIIPFVSTLASLESFYSERTRKVFTIKDHCKYYKSLSL